MKLFYWVRVFNAKSTYKQNACEAYACMASACMARACSKSHGILERDIAT